MNLMSRIRALPVAPAQGRWSAPVSAVSMHALRNARRMLGGRVGAQPPDRGTLKIISHDHKFVLMTIPKAGTKTFQDIFLRAPAIQTDAFGTESPPDVLQHRYGDMADYQKVVFVRNPWMRVASCYYDKIVRSHEFGKITILSRYPGLYPKMPFRAFVEWLLSPAGADEHGDRHWISQHRLLRGRKGELFADKIYKFENLEADFAAFCWHAGLPEIALRKKNVGGGTGTSLKDRYRAFYDAELIDMVAQRYARDIQLLSYQF